MGMTPKPTNGERAKIRWSWGGAGRVLRGGGWGSVPGLCRSAYRFWYGPAGRDSDLGFRVALQSVR